eukprot:888484_1
MPSPCLDSEDEYEEMNECMTVCPMDKDVARTNTTQTNNNGNSDESDKNGNNNNIDPTEFSGGSNGSESGFTGSGNRDDDDDKDEEKESTDDTEDDHNEHRNEDDETDQFIYFLMHKIETCDDLELREVLSSFSDACMDKVLGSIETVYSQKIRISKMRRSMADSMRMKKQKPTKKKKKKSKSWCKMQRNMQSLNPLHITSQYQMYISFTRDVIPSKVIGIPAIGSDVSVRNISRISYDYIIKSVAINEDNCYVNPQNTMQIFHFGLHLKSSKQDAYFIATRQYRDRRRYDWLVNEILTKPEICAKYSDITLDELPSAYRIDTSYEIKQVEEEIMKLKGQPQRNIAWNKIHIFGEKNNKRRMQLMYNNREFKARWREFIMRADEFTLFPIVMFDQNDNVLIQYVMIVSIEKTVDIAVSFKYDVSAKSPLSVVGIHLDKDLIYKQHQVLCTSQTCRHLSRFKSSINYMHIGNCDDLLNQKKALQKHNKALRETSKELQVKLDQMHSSTSYDSSYFNQHSLLSCGTSVNPSSSSDRYSHTLGQSMFDSLSDVTDVSNSQPYTPIDTGSRVAFSPLMMVERIESDADEEMDRGKQEENELMNVEDASMDTDSIERDEDDASGVIDATIRDRPNEMDKEIEMKQPTPLPRAKHKPPDYNYCEAFTKDDETFLFEKGNTFDCRERSDATFSDSTSEMDIRSPDPSELTFKHAHQPHRVHSDTSTSTLAANASKCQSSPSHDDITCDKSDLMDKQRQTKDASSVSITTPHGVNHQADDRDENPFDRDAMKDQLSVCVNETDICEDNVDARVQVDVSQANAKKPTLHKVLQSLRYKVHTMPSSCLDLEDEYEEMNEWMIACPTDNDTTHTKATPTHQNNNRDSDE